MKKLLIIGLVLLTGCAQTEIVKPAVGKNEISEDKTVKTEVAKSETVETKVVQTEEEKILQLIKQLGDDDWQKREEATQKLIEIGRPTTKYLKKVIKHQDAEIRLRTKLILSKIGDLIAYWKFDENKGTIIKDSSGNDHDGEIHGAKWITGTVGSALSFDGVDDYIDVGDTSSLSDLSALTICAWIKNSDTSGWHAIVAKRGPGWGNNEWALYVHWDGTTPKLRIVIYDESADAYIGRENTTTNYLDGIWHHVVGTWDGGTSCSNIKVYVDGIQVDDADVNGSNTIVNVDDTTSTAQIGGSGEGDYYFNGLIDEVKIYNYACSAVEIQEDYSKPK